MSAGKAVDLSQQVVASHPASVQVVDWDTLVADADSKVVTNERVFVEIGQHCRIIEKSHQDIGALVRHLRSCGIRLNDWSSFETAKMYMSQQYMSQSLLEHKSVEERIIQEKSLHKYCCHLRSLLSLPDSKLPDKISISAPVPSCFSPGDQIDVMDSTKNWWHAVLLSETKNMYNVYWVGFEPTDGSRRSLFKRNPEEVNKHSGVFRVHEDGAVSGNSAVHTADWVLDNVFSKVQPRTFREVVHIDDATSIVLEEATAA